MPAGNGILKGELKVRGGKLVKCHLMIKEGKIDEIRFTGDFFMYPEEKIEELEKELRGIEFNEGKIKNAMTRFFKDVEVLGACADDFVAVVMNAKLTK